MALEIIVKKSRVTQHERRSQRVKVLFSGRMNTESHKWLSVTFSRVFSVKLKLKVWRDSGVATGTVHCIELSCESRLSHWLQKKTNLQNEKVNCCSHSTFDLWNSTIYEFTDYAVYRSLIIATRLLASLCMYIHIKLLPEVSVVKDLFY